MKTTKCRPLSQSSTLSNHRHYQSGMRLQLSLADLRPLPPQLSQLLGSASQRETCRTRYLR